MRKLLIVLSLIIAVSIPMTIFAAPNNPVTQSIRGLCGIDTTNLTEQQTADLAKQFNKMVELRKESINLMIANGTITKAQGEMMLKNLEAMVSYRQQNGFTGGCGMGFGNGSGGGRGMMGRGSNWTFTAPTN